jgi:hypothetical protein
VSIIAGAGGDGNVTVDGAWFGVVAGVCPKTEPAESRRTAVAPMHTVRMVNLHRGS